jgi:hypothetical protein
MSNRNTFWQQEGGNIDPLFDPNISDKQRRLIKKQQATEKPTTPETKGMIESNLARVFPTSLPAHSEALSNMESKTWGGFDFLPVSHNAFRAQLYLTAKAQATRWLQDMACNALHHQSFDQRHAQFWLAGRARREMIRYETKEESLGNLLVLGQKVLHHEQTQKTENFNVLYEWASYALYRDSTSATLTDMGSRAVEQWVRQQSVAASLESTAQRALQHQISTHIDTQRSLHDIGQENLKVYLSKWMKKHEAHAWLIAKGLAVWRRQMRHAALQHEAADWLKSLGTQAVGREMLRMRALARERAKEKARENGLVVIKNIPEGTSVEDIIAQTRHIKDFTKALSPATEGKVKKPRRMRKDGQPSPAGVGKTPVADKTGGEGGGGGGGVYGYDLELSSFMKNKTAPETRLSPGSRPHSANSSRAPSPCYALTLPVNRSPSPLFQTLATMNLSREEIAARNVDKSQRDQDSMDMLLSSSSADNIIGNSTLRTPTKNEDRGRNVDQWSSGVKVRVPPSIQAEGLGALRYKPVAHGDSRIEHAKFTYSHGPSLPGSIGKKRLDESEQLFSVSLKKKARDIARIRAGQEGISPKHALANPPGPFVYDGAYDTRTGQIQKTQYASPVRMMESSSSSKLQKSPSDFFKTSNVYDGGVEKLDELSSVLDDRPISPSDFFKNKNGYGSSGIAM